ncbi:diacylglycerol kinase [Lentzea sp. NBRC 105346]|uniref:dihydrofolate reductase family protein n=1 Tax=Lentzea sp. NBRC 105346 TaxID=3032205 RepID=UPI0025550220|nr:dihydrofolate reductase family protein [Lentzea sp. NBRC 105346]GLZ30389.1 diacylglycerol kinase [Lentzea sp. NBRC 105346]
MRKLIYFVATTLDGFIAEEDGSFDGFLFEGDHMTAMVTEFGDTLPAQARQALGIDAPNHNFDTVLMGRNTYQVPGGLPSPYPHLRQYVVSSTLTGTPDDVEVISGNVVDKVRELKNEDGLDIWLCGGGKLAADLAGEIDVLHLKVHPIVFGTGVPLFDGKIDRQVFKPVGTKAYESGVVFTRFERT